MEAVTGPWAKWARPKPTALFGPRQPTALDVLAYSVRATGFSLWASFSLLENGWCRRGDYTRRVTVSRRPESGESRGIHYQGGLSGTQGLTPVFRGRDRDVGDWPFLFRIQQISVGQDDSIHICVQIVPWVKCDPREMNRNVAVLHTFSGAFVGDGIDGLHSNRNPGNVGRVADAAIDHDA